MKIDSNSNVPIYQQVVAEIQAAIASGVYRPGEAIPSARDLSLTLNVNPNTIQRAFDELDSLGVIETRRGLGKFVCSRGPRQAAKQSLKAVRQALIVAIQKAIDAGISHDEVEKIFADALQTSKAKTLEKSK